MIRRNGHIRFALATALTITGGLAVNGSSPAQADHDSAFETIDVNELGGDVDSTWAVMVDDLLFFDSDDLEHGRELWVLNTTTGDSDMIADLAPGVDGSDPDSAIAFKGMLFFNASDGTTTRAYQSDGTAVGTSPLGNWTIGDPVVFDNALFFAANVPGDDPSGEGGVGEELFRWDSTSGLLLADDLYAGAIGSRPNQLTVVDGATSQWLFFLGRSSGTGEELVRFNPAGSEIADTDPGSSSINADTLVAAGSELYAADNGLFAVTDVEVATFDASAVTTLPGTGIFVRDVVGTDGGIYFIGGAFPYVSVYWSAGGAAATIVPGLCTYGPLVPFGATVIFNTASYSPTCSSSSGYLGRADGPMGTTTLLTSERVFPLTIVANDSGDQALFFANDPIDGPTLWSTDGTETNAAPFSGLARPVRSAVGVFANTTGHGNTWWMLGSTPADGTEWWASDGTAIGTDQVGTISAVTADSFARDFTQAGDVVVFSADGGEQGEELWRYDPVTGLTSLLADLDGDIESRPNNFETIGTLAMFETNESTLQVTDGSSVTDFLVAAGLDGYSRFVGADDRFFVAAQPGTGDSELYVSDGTGAGTALVKDINPTDSSSIRELTPVGRDIFFSADDGTTGNEPWFSDGTGVGTIRLADTTAGVADGFPSQFTAVGDDVYFVTDDYRLWKTDRTPAGTAPVDLVDGAVTTTNVNYIASSGDKLFVTDSDNRARLWVIEGTNIERLELAFDMSLSQAASFDGLIVTEAYDTNEGSELAVSDGTAAGTYQIPLIAGEAGISVYEVVAGTHAAFFLGYDEGRYRYGLWRTEGTAGTTEMVTDLGTGYIDVNLGAEDYMNVVGDRLFVSGKFPAVGGEALIIDVGPHVPGRPTGASAIAGDASATVSWAAPADDGGAPLAGYTAIATPGGASCTTAGATTCVVTGLANGTSYTFRVSASNRRGDSLQSVASAAVVPKAPVVPDPPDAITPIDPARYWDSRDESTFDTQFANTGRLGDRSFQKIRIAGRGGVPADASAVVGNVTVIFPDGPGYSTIYPCTGVVPRASTLNYDVGDVLANNAIVPLDGNGDVCVYTLRGAHYALDINGFTPSDSPIVGMNPARYLETRAAESTFDGKALGAGRTADRAIVEVQIAGRGAVPADATAAIVNASIIFPDGPGYATLFPCGTIPTSSNINYFPSAVTPNGAVSQLSASGTLCIFTLRAADIILDVSGYVPAGSEGITTRTPARFADTRPGKSTIDGASAGTGRVTGREFIEVQITGRNGVPASATAAILNLGIIDPSGAGYATLYPCGTRPRTSNLNHTSAGVVRANNAITKLSASGSVCVFTLVDAGFIVDVAGYLE